MHRTIVVVREDGDYGVLASVNNTDHHLTDQQLETLAETLLMTFELVIPDSEIKIIEDELLPDYISDEEGEVYECPRSQTNTSPSSVMPPTKTE